MRRSETEKERERARENKRASEEGSAHRGGQVDAIVIYFPAVDYNITQADGDRKSVV